MAKGQMRGTREKKKPKAEWNKKRKGGPAPTPFAATTSLANIGSMGKPGQQGKK